MAGVAKKKKDEIAMHRNSDQVPIGDYDGTIKLF